MTASAYGFEYPGKNSGGSRAVAKLPKFSEFLPYSALLTTNVVTVVTGTVVTVVTVVRVPVCACYCY
eukprot:184265-Rhodomonas_salina.2